MTIHVTVIVKDLLKSAIACKQKLILSEKEER